MNLFILYSDLFPKTDEFISHKPPAKLSRSPLLMPIHSDEEEEENDNNRFINLFAI